MSKLGEQAENVLVTICKVTNVNKIIAMSVSYNVGD
jgi:hypothetical protein